jgi:hypothetical protein
VELNRPTCSVNFSSLRAGVKQFFTCCCLGKTHNSRVREVAAAARRKPMTRDEIDAEVFHAIKLHGREVFDCRRVVSDAIRMLPEMNITLCKTGYSWSF